MSLLPVDVEDLKDQAEAFDYLRITWSDIHGIARGKTIPARHASSMLEDGVGCFSGQYQSSLKLTLYIPFNR